ncbi:MAG: ATP-dependent helicase [Candidatus Zixiibacteriota bacterium]
MINFETQLNSEQYLGVKNTEGPVLVLAGAGSGKTRLLTHKLAYLIQELGIAPSTIMAVTFTNKAANEMKERVESLLSMDITGLWIGTFHSIAGRILRREAKKIGLDSSYTIYDANDSSRLIKNILDDYQYKTEMKPKNILGIISNLKVEMISPEEYAKDANGPKEQFIAEVYQSYQDLLFGNNAVDFDDMILHVVRLFKNDQELLEKWSKEFRYLLVDEFQDTNLLQYEFVRLLSSHYRNLTVVGDDDQSIYSWRGARIDNILNFNEDFAGTTTVKLEQNYRSTQNILSAAGAVVEQNPERHPKKLWTERGMGNLIEIREFGNDDLEADAITSKIKKLLDEGVKPSEIAILYRVNSVSRLFENKLHACNISYEVIGGQKFYERAEIKDILAYLRLIVNKNDDLSFERIINQPKRGIGAKSQENLKKCAKMQDMNLLELVMSENFDCPVSSKAKKGISAFAELMFQLIDYSENMNVAELMEATIEMSGYAQMLIDKDTDEGKDRLQNLGELQSSAQQFIDNKPEDSSLKAFLEETALISEVDKIDDDVDKVNLMTIHSAKGLEFEHVFIVALEDGIFPIIRDSSDSDMCEERRLLYVAITRGKDHVHISHSASRQRFGKTEPQIPSRFVNEIPDKYADHDIKLAPKSRKKSSRKKKAASQYRARMRVRHPFFGIGIIIKVRGKGESTVLTINFKDHGVKKLVAAFAKLEIIK